MCSVAQSCLNLCDPMDCIHPGSFVHGYSQARTVEWVDLSFSMYILLNVKRKVFDFFKLKMRNTQTIKKTSCNVLDLGSIPGLGRFPWRRERLPILVFFPREFHGLYSPCGHKELDRTEQLTLFQ